MANVPFSKPVEDSVSKVNNEIDVGEDLEFQRKWWRFENFVWVLFSLILVLDLSGFLGRGPFAKAERRSADGTVTVRYERIERTSSSSILTIDFSPAAIRNGSVVLYISGSLVKELGARRIIPAPETSRIGEGGVTYTFPASSAPATVALDLEPPGPGIYNFSLHAAGAASVRAKVVVVP